MIHPIPGSHRSIGPFGRLLKGGRTHIGNRVMSLHDFTPAFLGVRRSRSSSRSRSRSSRSAGRGRSRSRR